MSDAIFVGLEVEDVNRAFLLLYLILLLLFSSCVVFSCFKLASGHGVTFRGIILCLMRLSGEGYGIG